MILVKVLDAQTTALISDLRSQLILRELVASEYSVTELSNRLNIPAVTLWKRMQKFEAAGLVEVTAVKKSGNLERKMYRATAANFVPFQMLSSRPKDRRLSEAFDVYSEIQKMALALQSQSFNIPEGTNPVDYAQYVGMKSMVVLQKAPDFQRKIVELGRKLSEYESKSGPS
jgi:DNA-binding Lrp family transcriptional regulator